MKKWRNSSRAWVSIPNENTDEKLTCFGSHIKTIICLLIGHEDLWIKTNWTQKLYFSLINHHNHLQCQLILFRRQKVLHHNSWTKIKKHSKLKNLPTFFLSICYTLKRLSLFAAKDAAIFTTTWLTTNNNKIPHFDYL